MRESLLFLRVDEVSCRIALDIESARVTIVTGEDAFDQCA